MKQYAVSYASMPYPGAKGDTSTAAIMAKVRSLKAPFTVMVPRMTSVLGDPKDPVARAVARAYGVSVKALPKSIKLAPGETLIAPPPIIPAKP